MGLVRDNPAKLRLAQDMDITERSVKLDLLDESGRLISYGTGLLMTEDDGTYLYTCWHVITGYDFLELKVKAPPAIRKVALRTKTVRQENPAVIAIGGEKVTEYALYDAQGLPVWQQEEAERPHPDLNAIGIRIPKHCDLVRLRVEIDDLARAHQSFVPNDVWHDHINIGTPVLIGGYPYGYSAFHFPEPVFLTRSIATMWTKIPFVTLLDGTGAHGMSGSPVYVKIAGKWALYGVYTGILFPDYQQGLNGDSNDRHAALGLMLIFKLGRIMLGVKDFGPGAPSAS